MKKLLDAVIIILQLVYLFSSILPPEQDPELLLIKKIKNILSYSFKMNEVYNYSFVSEESLAKLDLDSKNYINLLNPFSKQASLLRQTLTTEFGFQH